jgi:hypothetical protein
MRQEDFPSVGLDREPNQFLVGEMPRINYGDIHVLKEVDLLLVEARIACEGNIFTVVRKTDPPIASWRKIMSEQRKPLYSEGILSDFMQLYIKVRLDDLIWAE